MSVVFASMHCVLRKAFLRIVVYMWVSRLTGGKLSYSQVDPSPYPPHIRTLKKIKFIQ